MFSYRFYYILEYIQILYARVNSTDQNLDRQIQELESYGCEHIIIEKESGKGFVRHNSFLEGWF
ncbi:recombinase family protein [Jeotgalibacillus marinus]|uniref:Recombinase family protein n=1 Tax=Jeotgalibacillus marinus TaxID=86667 RepID=A0ABV3PZV5_9BACL